MPFDNDLDLSKENSKERSKDEIEIPISIVNRALKARD